MKLFVILAVAATVAAAAEIARGKPDLDKEWQEFKGKHGKSYKNSADESERRKIWEANRDKVAKHNQEAASGLQTYTMETNHLSDLTPSELAKLAGTVKNRPQPRLLESREEQTIQSVRSELRQSSSLDLRSDPCMPPIKDQKLCGCCWSFSATTPVEWGLCKKNNNNLVLLSEQQLVDCNVNTMNKGCNGGDYPPAWDYIKENGQAKASDYPYTATNGTCKYNPSTSTATVTGFVRLGAGVTEAQIRAAIDQRGPVSAALHAVQTIYNYKSGIYTDSTCSKDGTKMDHAVVLVGYGSLNGIDYWILRNTWNTTWGLQGYMYIRRGTNECNIESDVAYPTF